MLPPDGQSDRFLIAKETKLVGLWRRKNEFCYLVDLVWMRMLKPCLLRPVWTIGAGKTEICQTCGLA